MSYEDSRLIYDEKDIEKYHQITIAEHYSPHGGVHDDIFYKMRNECANKLVSNIISNKELFNTKAVEMMPGAYITRLDAVVMSKEQLIDMLRGAYQRGRDFYTQYEPRNYNFK